MRILGLFILGSFLFACGDDDSSDTGISDASLTDIRVMDSGALDAGASADADPDQPDVIIVDAGVEVDVGPGVDAGTAEDAGTDGGEIDAGEDAGPAGPCDGLDIGRECPCADPYVCRDGRCVPGRGRATCGGFVGAICMTRTFPECTYRTSSDFGPCLSTEERLCVCAEHRDQYACRGI